jgi:hypothetical protein
MRNLIYWRGIEDAAFKPADGGFLFYPYGALARGYVVTPEKKAELAAHLRRFYLVSTIALFVLIVVQAILNPIYGYFTGLFAVIPLILLLFVYFHLGLRARLAGVPRTAERLSFAESQRMATRTMSDGRVKGILACGVLLVAASLALLAIGLSENDRQMMLMGGFSTVFFGALFLIGCYNAWLKWRRQA